MATRLKARAILRLGYGAGLRAGEVTRLKVKHIDGAQMIIHVEQVEGRKDRNVMLSPETHMLLRAWWRVRPALDDEGVPTAERLIFPAKGRSKSSPHVSSTTSVP